MNNRWRLAILGVLLSASPLASQRPEVRIEAARARLEASGLPVTLIDERVAEGRAKGIPLARIAEAIERRSGALLRAGEALRPAVDRPSLAELSAGADAVEAGIPPEALRRVIARARAADRAVALAVLTFLHRQQGLPIETALERVAEAAGRGPDALRDLPARTAAARALRPGPRATGDTLANSVRQRAPARRPAVTRPENARPPAQRQPEQGGVRP